MGSMEVEAHVRLHFGSCEGVQQSYPEGYPWSCCQGLAVGIGEVAWIFVDLGIRSAGLTPMTISGPVLHTHPLAPSLPPTGFGFIPDVVWSLTRSVVRVSSALAMAGRRKFLLELSASLQIPQRGVKCSYFHLLGTDIYSCHDATANL